MYKRNGVNEAQCIIHIARVTCISHKEATTSQSSPNSRCVDTAVCLPSMPTSVKLLIIV